MYFVNVSILTLILRENCLCDFCAIKHECALGSDDEDSATNKKEGPNLGVTVRERGKLCFNLAVWMVS
jgi:hypothetical protein